MASLIPGERSEIAPGRFTCRTGCRHTYTRTAGDAGGDPAAAETYAPDAALIMRVTGMT